ncbi:nuclear transport factor 2 family protein [Cellulosimicrobium sp. CUA-896]|uniref:nuclear transport factor 2 family protein n=1 Tax=Cellulosimicrobium sp. CUA-896 TaxID=1517881 RepID=UPI000965C196|nr:nuclear transport factor 2 family protein [Cellulosimicrobium sp. CUA-896]OLT46129.1 hypothetical protein BJF88_04730 [Cellulosimicrobium sp. CUA-896]
MSDNPSAREARNDEAIRAFLAEFEQREASRLTPYLTDDVTFENYGDAPLQGRSALVSLWAGVFRTFERVRFETLNQAVDGDTVIAEQIHGLALPGRDLAPIRNLAVYELRDGRIAAWRDCTNPAEASRLLGV